MEVICIDDSCRPNEIPISHWVKKGQKYTVLKIMWAKQQNIYGFVLAEIDLTPFFPYQFFAVSRFGMEVSIKELVKEMEMEVV